MSNTTQEINWRQNCLTRGPHDGRQEPLWMLPLGYAVLLYGHAVLEELVVTRIYNDAMQMAEYGLEPRMPKEWAERVKELSHERFAKTLGSKIQELDNYYNSNAWTVSIQSVVGLVKRQKLNSRFQPLHDHDTINMMCRILGTGASLSAALEFPSES